jgi:hypothetical protein
MASPNSEFTFTCNLCGMQNLFQAAHYLDPELPSCSRCQSNVRFRWLIDRITREFAPGKSVKGIGLTDPTPVAAIMEGKFTYLNTFLDSEPRLNIRCDPSPLGPLDFLIASEVFEHVEPPVMDAFHNAAKMLKPSGVLLLTVPWVHEGDGTQVIPELYDWKLARENDDWVIADRDVCYPGMTFDGGPGPSLGYTREHFREWPLPPGGLEAFQNLVFHGGPVFSLEMRLFTRGGIEDNLRAAGFFSIQFDTCENRKIGVVFPYPWSHPIIARKEA